MAKTNEELSAKITNASTAPAMNPAQQVQAYLMRMKDQIACALPKHMTPDRVARIALTEIRTNPKLLECSIESLMACVMKASQEGLEFGTGHAYLVPFYNNKTGRSEAQYIRGYLGSVELARRSGQIVSIGAGVVKANDKFEFERGYDEKLKHVPNFTNPGEIIGFYAYALLKDGGRQGEFMTLAEVNKIRERSKAKSFGPWVTDFEAMGKKTVLRRLCKLLPLSIEIFSAIGDDERIEFGELATAAISTPVTKVEHTPLAEDEIPDFGNGGTHKAVKDGDLFADDSTMPAQFEEA